MTVEIPGGRLSHVRYQDGRFLQAADFRREQGLHQLARRRHHVGLHDWGVVSGLELELDPERPTRQLSVTAGYALDRQGRELVLPRGRSLDLVDLGGFDWDTQALRLLVRHHRTERDGRHPDLPAVWVEGLRFDATPIPRTDLAGAPDGRPALRPQDLRDGPDDGGALDDDEDQDWLVLGALAAAPSGPRRLVVLPDARRRAGLVGGRLQAADGTLRLELGDGASLLRLERAPDALSPAEEVLFEVPARGPARLGGSGLSVPALQVGPGGVTFAEARDSGAPGSGFRLRRVGSVLRCELPVGGRLELGAPGEDPCLAVDGGGVALFRAAPPEDEAQDEGAGFPWAAVIAQVVNALVAITALLVLKDLLKE